MKSRKDHALKRGMTVLIIGSAVLAGCGRHPPAAKTEAATPRHATMPADPSKRIDWVRAKHQADVLEARQKAAADLRAGKEAAAIAQARRTGHPVVVHFMPAEAPQTDKDGPPMPRTVTSPSSRAPATAQPGMRPPADR